MPFTELFPTVIYRDCVTSSAWNRLRTSLRKEALAFQELDKAGVKWSKENYPGGYTSYGSLDRLFEISPTFEEFRSRMKKHVDRYVKNLEMELGDRDLEMQSCWVNVMGPLAHHSMHLHPQSVISGTFYVDVPPGSGVFKIEDPRIACFMGAPSVAMKASLKHQRYVKLTPKAGDLILFESWLKHEVPAHLGKKSRISVSFNYGLK